MSSIHICTTESLRAGIDEPPSKCFMCENETMYTDWVGCRCDTCGADTAWEGDLAGFVRSIRNKTGLTRREIADKSKLKPLTIRSYEWDRPSKKYLDWFKGFIRDFYKETNNRR